MTQYDYATDLLGEGKKTEKKKKSTSPGTETGYDYAADLLGSFTGKARPPVDKSLIPQRLYKKKGGKLYNPNQPVTEAVTTHAQRYFNRRDTPPYVVPPGVKNPDYKGEGAKYGTLVKSEAVNDPGTKIKIFAADRFPELSEKEREARYGVEDGEIVFIDHDGRKKRENPNTFGAKLKRFGATLTARPLSTSLGTLGASVGPIGAFLGASGGRGLERSAAGLIFNEPQTVKGNLIDVGTEGVFSLIGEKYLGGGGKRFLEKGFRTRGGRIAQEAGRLIDSKKAGKLIKAGEERGIKLHPHQVADDDALIKKAELLGDLPRTAQKFGRAKIAQLKQVDKAVYKFLDQIAPETTALDAGGKAVKAAKGALEAPKKLRSVAVRPLYKKAFKEADPVNVGKAIDEIDKLADVSKGDSKAAVLKIKEYLFRNVDGKAVPERRLEALDNAKKQIDKFLSGPEAYSIQKDVKRKILSIKDALVSEMKKASPDYEKALKLYGELSPAVKKVDKSLLGQVSRLEGDASVKAIKTLINSTLSTPETAGRAMQLIRQQSPETADAVTRSYIQTTFEKIKHNIGDEMPNLGGHLYKNIIGNQQQRKIMKSVMTKEQYKNMTDFFEILRRTGIGWGKNSATSARQETSKEMRAKASSKLVSLVGGEITAPLKLVSQGINERLFYRWHEQLADAMLSPKAAEKIQKMKNLSPKSEELIRQLGAFLGMSAGREAEKEVRKGLREERPILGKPGKLVEVRRTK